MRNALKDIALQVENVLRNDVFHQHLPLDFMGVAVRDYPLRGGKRLRPALLMWCCGLLGGKLDSALYPACAAEVFHNWTLVHDDIIDRDDFRRGVPTCHKQLQTMAMAQYKLADSEAARFGQDFAILAGDWQQGWANSLLLQAAEHGVPADVTLALAKRMQEFTNRELIAGEALDVEFSYRGVEQVSAAEVERMMAGKTGVLLQFCAESGAMIALNDVKRERPETLALGRMAMAAAIAFQLRDDYLGVFGNAGFGKPLGADLSERKATLLLLKAFELLSDAGKKSLNGLLGKTVYDENDLGQIQALFIECGAADFVCRRAEELTGQAVAELEALPENQYKKYLSEFIVFMCGREV